MPNTGEHLKGHSSFRGTIKNPAKRNGKYSGWIYSLKEGERIAVTYITDVSIPGSNMYCRDYVYDTVRTVTYHSNGIVRVRLVDTNYLIDETCCIISPAGVNGKICHPDYVKNYILDKEVMIDKIKQLRYAPYDMLRWVITKLEG